MHGRAYAAGALPLHVARKTADGARAVLREAGVPAAHVDISAVREDEADAVGSGSGIVMWAETEGGCVLGGSAVGTKGKDARKVGAEAARELLNNIEHGGCVDEYLQVGHSLSRWDFGSYGWLLKDQLIIFLALAEGVSTVVTGPLTMHTRTAIWTAQAITNTKFEIDESSSPTVIIKCHGIGYTTPEDDDGGGIVNSSTSQV